MSIQEEPIYLNEAKEIDSCLVACFEEHDNVDDFDSVDTRIFVTYDHDAKSYIINGKRVDIFSKKGRNKTNFQPFVFCTEESNEVADFILLSFCRTNNMSYILYNYNNLPEDACDMSYDFMENNMDRRYEITAFDNIVARKTLIKRLVKMTRYMYN